MRHTELQLKLFEMSVANILKLLFVGIIYLLSFSMCSVQPVNKSKTETAQAPTIDQGTGLVIDEGMGLVITNCTSCHSSKLIMQNRATKEGWKSIITWMQQTQNLWPLGLNEEPILNYLAKNYAPEPSGRRKPLEYIQWYKLNN